MSRRTIELDGENWTVSVSGRVSTSYSRDEVSLVFALGTGENSVQRVCRFRPFGKPGAGALADISDSALQSMLRASQPAWTSPELSYGKKALHLFEG